MKKIIALLLMINLIFALFGCAANNMPVPSLSETTSNHTTEEAEPFKYLGYPIDWISDIPLSEIKSIKYRTTFDIQPNMFITESGDLYLFSTDKLFSNDKTCKKVDTDLKFDRFYLYPDDRNHSTIVSIDEDFYNYNKEDDQINADNSLRTDSVPSKYIKKRLNSYGEWQGGYRSYSIYYYIKGNDLYKASYREHEDLTGLNLELDSETIIDTVPDGETFISLDGKVIKTDKAFYKVGVKNREETEKYEDVKPIEGLEKIEDASEQYDDIEYFNWSFIIYKNDDKHIYEYNYY